eukprot:scaffold42330_cov97-Phaeocystis_antarctica.AAC.2
MRSLHRRHRRPPGLRRARKKAKGYTSLQIVSRALATPGFCRRSTLGLDGVSADLTGQDAQRLWICGRILGGGDRTYVKEIIRS